MKKKAMKSIYYIAFAVLGAAAGFGGGYMWNMTAAQPVDVSVEPGSALVQPSAESVQIRVRGGQIEWFDGKRWNTGVTLEELAQNDPIEARSDAWNTLAHQRAAAKEEQRQEALAQFDREENALSVGEKPVARQPSAPRQPANTSPAPTTTPTPDPEPTPPPEPEWSSDML